MEKYTIIYLELIGISKIPCANMIQIETESISKFVAELKKKVHSIEYIFKGHCEEVDSEIYTSEEA